MNRRLAALIAVLLAVVAGGTVTVVITDDGGGRAPSPTVTPTATATPTPVLPPGASARDVDGSPTDLVSDLRAESGIPAADAARNRAFGRELRAPRRGGRAIAPPCRTDYSGHVWSDRAPGVTPTEFDLHYAVMRNVPGWGDVLGLEDYFSRVRLGSSHFIVDFEGHCLKMVPGAKKAWTQGNANSYAYSVEIIATGQESAAQWKASPLIKDEILARLVRSVMDAHGLPIVRVDPVGCVFLPGWTDHFALECGNNHTDVRRHFPFRVFTRQLRAVR